MNGCLLFNMADFQMGLVTTVLGFGTVFTVLILISIMLTIFGEIMVVTTNKNEKTEEKTPVKSNTVVVENTVAKENVTDDKELIAVITAAIAASMGGNVSPDKLVVRSLRRVKKSGWKNEAIHEQQNNIVI